MNTSPYGNDTLETAKLRQELIQRSLDFLSTIDDKSYPAYNYVEMRRIVQIACATEDILHAMDLITRPHYLEGA